jgi:hypothetical protein
MMRLAFFSAAMLALALTGCAAQPVAPGVPLPSTPGSAETGQPAGTPLVPPTGPTDPGPVSAPTPGVPVVSTSVGVVSSGPAQPATLAAATPTTAGGPTQPGGLVITRANNRQTISLHAGDRFVLLLGDEYQWTVTISDQTVLHRVINITPIRGSQGVFEALQPGSAQLVAVGDPACRQSTPPCMLPSYSFELNVTVIQ